MKVLVNITEITTKLVEVEVPAGMDTDTALEWARDKVEADYCDEKIDMTVDVDCNVQYDIVGQQPTDTVDVPPEVQPPEVIHSVVD